MLVGSFIFFLLAEWEKYREVNLKNLFEKFCHFYSSIINALRGCVKVQKRLTTWNMCGIKILVFLQNLRVFTNFRQELRNLRKIINYGEKWLYYENFVVFRTKYKVTHCSASRTVLDETLQPSDVAMLIRDVFLKLFHQRNQVVHPREKILCG